MRLFTSLKLGSYKPFALAVMMLVSAVFTAIAWPVVPEANAITAETCYGLNDKVYFSNNQDYKDCVQQGYCEVYQFKTSAYTTEDRVRCNEELYQARTVDPANNAAILNTQVTPVVDIICAGLNSGGGRQECSDGVKARYVVCANGAEEGSPTENQINSAIASCIRDWAKTAYPTKNFDLNTLAAAIAKGRSDGGEQATQIGAEKAKKDCETAGGTWANGECALPQAVLCSGGALGWIMCPLAELATSVTEFFAGLINSFLTFSPLLTSAQGKAIQGVWQLIVNIANVLLVIAFLMVVFSQATSVGLSNYGIKKMLPKIIAAAILMNLSFFICAVAIDISNVLGQSVAGIIQVGIDQVDKSVPIAAGNPLSDIKSGSDGGDIAFVSLLGALGIGGLIVAPGLLYFILPILVSAAAAMFTALGVIIFRQVALVIMIIISPLAFVAWILPNTESWFEKWRKFFIALLAMFPLIMAIFYGATFLSHIMLLTLDPSKPTEMNIVKIMALAVLVLPLFALPFVMKMAGGILERFGAIVNNRQKGLIDRSRNWAKDSSKRTNASQRARMAQARWGYERDDKGKLKKDKDGNLIERKGRGAEFARRASSSANFVGGYASNRDRKHGWQEENAKRIQDEQLFEMLAETDEKGNPTARAERYATAAAGAGGEKNAERIRRLALEQKKKAYVEDVGRETSAYVSSGVTDSGAYFYEFDDAGNVKTSYSDQGRAFTALARGDTNLGVVKAGQPRDVETAKKNIVRGDTEYKRDAAIKRLWDTGDGNGLGMMLYGGTSKNEITGVDEYVAPIADEAFSNSVQWMDAGKISSKLSHLVTNDNGLNGVSGDAMANWHGNEFKAAASRVRQLRERGDYKGADKIQRAVEDAYETLATDPNLAKDFKEKHVGAMRQFKNIVEGKEGRAVLREYGDSTAELAKDPKFDAGNGTYDVDTGKLTLVFDKQGNLETNPDGSPKKVQVESRIKDIYMGNAAKFAPTGYTPPAGSNTGPRTQSAPASPIQLTMTSPTFTGPTPAAEVITQVQTAGGWNKLEPDAVMDIYNHAAKLPANTDSTQLVSEALDELRNRGYMPPGSGTP